VSVRVRLLVAALVVALVAVAAVVVAQHGGSSESPAMHGKVATEPVESSPPFRIFLPKDERRAERLLTHDRMPALPSLDTFLLISSLPVVPRSHELQPPPPPLRIHRLHLTPTRIALTAREAPLVPSDLPPRDWPKPTVAGALPDGFRFQYDDDYHGWPVAPLHGWHVLHGGFDDPRAGGYHFGIDIAVDDSHPALQAPKGLSHRVYAVEDGTMHWAKNTLKHPCNARRFDVGHFSYWHVTAAVPYGSHVVAGEMIGWTCLNEWHVHLSEWARVDGQKRWVNPLHPGGVLAPIADRSAPKIRAVYAYGPPSKDWHPTDTEDITSPDGAPELGLQNLHGAVDLRAWIDDSQGFLGVFRAQPDLASTTAPYKVQVQIRQLSTNAIVWQRITFQNDLLMSGVLPFYALYAAGSQSDLSDYDCLHSHITCAGRLLYHLISVGGRYLWDTRSVEDGAYRLTIRAYDEVGNVTTRVVTLRVRN
jgi:hypothetical protein